MSLGFTLGISSTLCSQKTPSETAPPLSSTRPLRAGYSLRSTLPRLSPAPRPPHRIPPAAEQLIALGRGHRGLVGGRLTPHLAHLIRCPQPGGDPGQVRGAERGRLGDL